MRPARGFTLLEMTVVLVILGLVTAVVAPSILRGIGAWQRRGEVDELVGQVRGLPARARAAGRAIELSNDALQGDSPPLAARDGARVATDAPWTVRHNGVCEGGVLHLLRDGRDVRIDVAAPFCDATVAP